MTLKDEIKVGILMGAVFAGMFLYYVIFGY
nr:MAG TPA: hypothetical protein [Bacteriophage sp.]